MRSIYFLMLFVFQYITLLAYNYTPDHSPACGIQIVSVDYTLCANDSFKLLVVFEQNGCSTNSQYKVVVLGYEGNTVVEEYVYSPINYMNTTPYEYYEATVLEPWNCNLQYKVRVVDLETNTLDIYEVPPFCCDCLIQGFHAEAIPNSCNNGVIEVAFNFEPPTSNNSFGLNGYTVTSGNVTQTYSLSDPRVIVLPESCNDPVILVINDNSNPNCSAAFTMANLCCDCELIDLVLETSPCVNDHFNLFASIDVTGSCSTGSWYATIDGQSYDLDPLQNGNYVIEGLSLTDSIYTISICSNASTNFCIESSFVNPCYQGNNNTDCEITSFTVDSIFECSGNNALLTFDFTANATFGIDGYIVVYNGIGTTFLLTDPRVLSYPADCQSNSLIYIYDINDQDCAASTTIPSLCCPCLVDSMAVNVDTCMQGSFNIAVLLEATGSCMNGSWTVGIGNAIYPLEKIGDIYKGVGLTSSDSLVILSICSEFGDCYPDTIINPCFNTTSLPCSISAFEVMPDSICDQGFILSTFTYTAQNFGLSGYTVTDGLNTTTFVPGLPQWLESFGNCDGETIFTITDLVNPNCTMNDTVSLCCPCALDSVSVSTSTNCDSIGLFAVEIHLFGVEGNCSNGPWSLMVEDSTYVLWPTNAANTYFYNGIFAEDSILIVKVCNFPEGNICVTDTIINPCYQSGNGNKVCIINSTAIQLTNQPSLKAEVLINDNGECGTSFDVWYNNLYAGTYTTFENQFSLPITENAAQYTFQICKSSSNGICKDTIVINPFFTSGQEEVLTEKSYGLNYVNGQIHVTQTSASICRVDLYNAVGQVVWSSDIHGQSFYQKMTLTSGLYVATFTTSDKKVVSKKMVVGQ